MGKIFVRARPNKISIVETYTYKGVIGDNTYWEFIDAEGEIKLVFPFDGYYQGSFNRAAQKDLRRQDPDKQAAEAGVGHLAIVKAGKTSFKQAGFEGETIPIVLDVENIQAKLESSQEFSTNITYKPNPPEAKPFVLGNVKFTDQAPFTGYSQMEYRPRYYSTLMLLMEFSIRMRDDVVDPETLSTNKLKELIEILAAGQSPQIRAISGDSPVDEIASQLLKLLRTNQSGVLLGGVTAEGKITGLEEDDESTIFEKIAEAVLSKHLPIPIIKPGLKPIEKQDDDKQNEKKIAIIITPPGMKAHFPDNQTDYDRENNLVVERDYNLDRGLVEELLDKRYSNLAIFDQITSKEQGEAVEDRLAKIMAGLANLGGGYLLFGARSRAGEFEWPRLDYDQLVDYESQLQKALRLITPQKGLTCTMNSVRETRQDGSRRFLLVVKIAGALSEVYSAYRHCWQLTIDEKLKGQISKVGPDEVFKLLSKQYKHLQQRAVLQGEPPKINYGYLKWPYTRLDENGFENSDDMPNNCCNLPGNSRANLLKSKNGGRKTYLPDKYDPSQGALEWHEVMLEYSGSPDFLMATLQVNVQTPSELRNPANAGLTRDIEGRFEILLGPPANSGLEIVYFNAQGEKLEKAQAAQIISYQTKLVLEVKLLTSDLFKKRDFSPYRVLEFEGVLPEPARYTDIEEALQDCGLRTSKPVSHGPIIRMGLPRESTWLAERRTADGKFTILLAARNRWYEIQREISYGERTDKMPVQFGGMTITVYGEVEGAKNSDLTDLINKLQQHLKERLKFVRVG